MATWTSRLNATDKQLLADGVPALGFALQDIPWDPSTQTGRTALLNFVIGILQEGGWTNLPTATGLRTLLGV